ncbi:GIY-YIG nuclease family protein [Streptomyces longwoodensis]|uniref:GIY-YIG nuclease family protein n=1 Tax=Streptomyces longwoodensis TaxID=68231 RepID=UPI00380F3D54
MPDEVVYVLGTPGSNTVKIGRTTNLAKRVADIQRMSPVPPTALWHCPGGHELETRLHRHFSNLRSHGEWFTFRVSAVQLIQWAVEDEPWKRKKISLRKAPKKVARAKRIPAPRVPLSESNPELNAAINKCVGDILRAIQEIPDPLEQYKETLRVQAWAKRTFSGMQQEAVLNLKGRGLSWREVGEELGVSGARAEQISRCAR